MNAHIYKPKGIPKQLILKFLRFKYPSVSELIFT
jgi:hypothetical protein